MFSTQPTITVVTAPEPGRYRLDPRRSTIAVRTRHLLGLSTVRGSFELRGGHIVVTEPADGSSVEAVADAASFSSGNPARDKKVRSSALLNADHHPDLGFVSGSVSRTGDIWTVHGTLTARGASAPLQLTVIDTTEAPDALTIIATGRVDRYAHGITGVKGLAGRRLDVTITAVVEKAA